MLVAFTFVFILSYLTFAAIKATIGLRVTDEEEDAGLDIVEHGMYGYPEAFIPAARDRCRIDRSRGSVRGSYVSGNRDSEGGARMKKLEAFIRHEAFEPIRLELLDKGFPSLSISEVKGSGRQKGITEQYRGSALTIHLRPKLKLEIVVEDKDVGVIKETILKHGRTGQVGDGKIFILPVEEAVRIRTGEDGEPVLQAHDTEEIPAGT